MIQNSLLGFALCTQFFTGTVPESIPLAKTAYEQDIGNSDVNVSIDGNQMEDTLIVNEMAAMDITSDDSQIKAVYIDGESKDLNNELYVGPENEVVAIETDRLDCIVYPVQSVEMVEAKATIEDGEYSLCSDCQLVFDQKVELPVNVVLIQNGSLVQKVSCLNQDEVQIHFDASGTYQMFLEYEQFETLRGKINGKKEIQFQYSSHEPSVHITPLSKMKDGMIPIQVEYEADGLKEAYVLVDDGNTTTRYDEFDHIELKADQNEHKIFTVTGVVVDAYGRKEEGRYQVEIDRKPPSIQAFCNSNPLEEGQMTVVSDLSLFSYEIEDMASHTLSVFVNDQYVSDTLEGVAVSDQDVVKIELTATDPFQNETTCVYLLKIEKSVFIPAKPIVPALESDKQDTKEEKMQTTTSRQMPILSASEDYVEIIRDWSLDENHSVVLEKEKKTIVDHTKPFICILFPHASAKEERKAGDIARLTILNTVDYSNDCFSEIVINGETIDVKHLLKDELNNQYYEFELQEGINTIDAKAIDDSDNSTQFHEYIDAKKTTSYFSFVLGIGLAMGLGGLLWWLKKHVEDLDL